MVSEKKLNLVGVGYRASVQRQVPEPASWDSVIRSISRFPEGITIETPSQTEILVRG